MDPTILGFLLQDGVNTGAIYILISVSLIMIFVVTRIVFVPQGELVTFTALSLANLIDGRVPGTVYLLLGTGGIAFCLDLAAAIRDKSTVGLRKAVLLYVALPLLLWAMGTLIAPAGVPLAFKMVLAVAVITALGPVIYRLAFQPMAAASPLTLLIAALAAHFLIVSLGLYCFGPDGVRTPGLLATAFTVGPVLVSYQALLTLAACLIFNAALYLFFGKTVYGKALRATAINRRGAKLMGIGTDFSGQLVFALAAAIGAVSGLLIAPTTPIYYDSGFLIGLKGFVGAIIGGLGSYPLAALGSMSVGVIEAFAAFWASAYKEVILFTLILPLLFWRSRYDTHTDHV